MRIRSSSTESADVINMTSLIDVLFILIIFFLVTTTFKQMEDDRRVDLPVDQRNQALANKAGDLVKINIRKSGAYVIMDKPVTEEMVEKTMKEAVTKRPEVKVMIRADKEFTEQEAGALERYAEEMPLTWVPAIQRAKDEFKTREDVFTAAKAVERPEARALIHGELAMVAFCDSLVPAETSLLQKLADLWGL